MQSTNLHNIVILLAVVFFGTGLIWQPSCEAIVSYIKHEKRKAIMYMQNYRVEKDLNLVTYAHKDGSYSEFIMTDDQFWRARSNFWEDSINGFFLKLGPEWD